MKGGQATKMTESLAIEIYRLKHTANDQRSKTPGAKCLKPGDIAEMFQVTPKAVRDIWNHVTWKYATKHLWTISSEGWSGRLQGSKVRNFFCMVDCQTLTNS
jgi:hypothetical protein